MGVTLELGGVKVKQATATLELVGVTIELVGATIELGGEKVKLATVDLNANRPNRSDN